MKSQQLEAQNLRIKKLEEEKVQLRLRAYEIRSEAVQREHKLETSISALQLNLLAAQSEAAMERQRSAELERDKGLLRKGVQDAVRMAADSEDRASALESQLAALQTDCAQHKSAAAVAEQAATALRASLAESQTKLGEWQRKAEALSASAKAAAASAKQQQQPAAHKVYWDHVHAEVKRVRALQAAAAESELRKVWGKFHPDKAPLPELKELYTTLSQYVNGVKLA